MSEGSEEFTLSSVTPHQDVALDYTAIINRLEGQIRQYRVDYQRFFNGDAKVPPEDQGTKIRLHLNELAAVSQLPSVDQYRLTGLEARFNSLSELFRRRLRDLDLPQQATTAAPPPAADTVASVIISPSEDSQEVGTLYDALYSRANSKVAPEDFHAYLLNQAAEVRKRTGCTKVRFTVRSDGGKKRLKARPMPSEG